MSAPCFASCDPSASSLAIQPTPNSEEPRLGTLLFCLDYAAQRGKTPGGVWDVVRKSFKDDASRGLYACLRSVNDFRNTYVAHAEGELTNADEAWETMREWVRCVSMMRAMVAG